MFPFLMNWEEGKENIFQVETGTGCHFNIAGNEVILSIFG